MTIMVGDKIYPSESAFVAVYVAAGLCGFAGAAVALFLPAHLAKRNEALSTGAGALAKEDPSLLMVNPHEFVMNGTIFDERGEPVGQAKVTYFTQTGQQIDFERTDLDGTYSIVLPEAGDYRIRVEHEGKAAVESIVSAAPHAALQKLTI
jgi:hypothetical protein